MSARDELAAAIAPVLVSTNPNQVQAFDDLPQQGQLRWLSRATAVADEILARYAVVELSVLPDPDGDGQIFLADAELRIDTSGHSGPEILTQDGNQITPTQLRFFAAEYLAAANRAEAQS